MMNKDWLKENIAAVLAIVWTVATITVYIIMLLSNLRADDNTRSVIVNSVTNIELLVLGYYFVSSKTASDRQRAELEIQKIKEEKTSTIAQVAGTEIKTENS